ncbi:glycosyltransferase [Paraglaciecola sp.]|uniref:glycosyltransferase n=1 Tax=Paraglaciecola sp. TaxID=1920173 RepID=UPI003EF81B87
MHKKVLHVFGIMNRGGAELRTLSTQQYMLDKGVQYDFLVLSGEKGVLDQQIVASGSQIYYCKLNWRFFHTFYAIIKQGGYTIVHSHVSLVSGLMLLVAWMAGANIRISHFRSTHDVESPSIIRKLRDVFLRRLLLTFSTKIVAVCKGAIDAFWHFDWSSNPKFGVIYNGFPIFEVTHNNAFWQEHICDYQGEKVLVNVARMHEQKNHVRLIEIFAALCKVNDDVLLILIGKEDADIKAEMQQVINENKIEKKVFYLGEKGDVLPFIEHSNMLLFPSKWEGLPGAVIESASLGVPVVGSDIPGIVEISQKLPVVTAVPLSSNNEQWVKVIQKQLMNPVDRMQSKQQFEKSIFQLERNAEQLYELYR